MEFFGFSVELLFALLLIAVAASFIDTLAGGGGLITIPALLIAGVPPLVALGTNKLQSCVGTGTATAMMFKYKKIRWHEIKYLMLLAFVGSAFGTANIQFINVDILSFVIPLVILSIAVYFILSPFLVTQHAIKPKLSERQYRYGVIPIIGCYDGMFGPGTGSFFSLAGVSLRAQGLIDATASAKAFNFSTNMASLFVFVAYGQVVWVIGLTMMLGQITGAWLGSHCLLKVSPKALRFLVVLMCLGMLIKYAFSADFL